MTGFVFHLAVAWLGIVAGIATGSRVIPEGAARSRWIAQVAFIAPLEVLFLAFLELVVPH